MSEVPVAKTYLREELEASLKVLAELLRVVHCGLPGDPGFPDFVLVLTRDGAICAGSSITDNAQLGFLLGKVARHLDKGEGVDFLLNYGGAVANKEGIH